MHSAWGRDGNRSPDLVRKVGWSESRVNVLTLECQITPFVCLLVAENRIRQLTLGLSRRVCRTIRSFQGTSSVKNSTRVSLP